MSFIKDFKKLVKPTQQVFMMIGLPGCGKSTLISEILKEYPDFHVASTDDIFEELAKADGISYSDSFAKYSKGGAVQAKFDDLARKAFKAGKSIIIDQTNIGSKARAGKLKKFYGAEFIAIDVSCDFTVLKTRLHERMLETGKRIPEFVVANMRNSYQAPTSAEGFKEILNVTTG